MRPFRKKIAGFETATTGILRFTKDVNDTSGSFEADGDIDDNDEDITYRLNASDDTNSDGIPDSGGVSSLVRTDNNGGATNIVMENVEAIEFNYILDNGTTSTSVSSGNLNNIRSVQISILVRSSKSDYEYTDKKIFTTPSGTFLGPYNDNFRRKFGTTTVYCNNMEY